jgi:serine/threonine protein kinase
LLRGIDHPNIHSMLSVSVEDNYVPLVIYPIMEYGNLHQFLVLCRITPADSPLSVSVWATARVSVSRCVG